MEIHEESLKGQYVSICIYLDLSLLYVLLIKIDQCFLNGRFRSNHIFCDSNLLKTFETEKKACAVNENVVEFLKRKITVKPCCALYNFSITF